MRAAFKEWRIVVEALNCGQQILILRKGGISEGRGGFKVAHPEFLLFPTMFHQQRDGVIPEWQARFDQLAGTPDNGHFQIQSYARLIEWHELRRPEDFKRLAGQHIWREEVISARFDWGKEKQIFALALRVFRFPRPVTFPMRPEYGGCKSWIDLQDEVDGNGASPALSDDQFSLKLRAFREALAND